MLFGLFKTTIKIYRLCRSLLTINKRIFANKSVITDFSKLMTILLNLQKNSTSLTQHIRTHNLNASVYILSINGIYEAIARCGNTKSQLREWVHVTDVTYNSIC